MTAQGRPNRTIALATGLAPLALVIVAEAAWISVVAGLLQEFALHEPILGIPELAAFVVAGVLLARLLEPRLGRRWLLVGFGLVVTSGVLGWLGSAVARDELASGPGPALAAHPGGWLAGLAMLRGFAHARMPLAEDTIANLLAMGVPGLALAATLGGVIAEPYRTRFLGDSLSAAIVFIGVTVLALAFARLDAIGLDSGFDWRRNPPWLLLMVAMVAAAIVLAIPLAGIAGSVISVLISVSLGPLLILGFASGFDRIVRRVMQFVGVVILVFVLVRLFGSNPITIGLGPGGGLPGGSPPTANELVTIGMGGLLLLGLIVAVIVAIALWMRRSPAPDGPVDETRRIDPSGEGLVQRRRRSRFGRRHDPTTAVEAYVALIRDLERHPAVRREPAETPAAHAARIRSLGEAALSLDLLAADYALARYGEVELSAAEDDRAIGRWRRLRRRLVAWAEQPGRRPGSATEAEAELPVDREPRRTL